MNEALQYLSEWLAEGAEAAEKAADKAAANGVKDAAAATGTEAPKENLKPVDAGQVAGRTNPTPEERRGFIPELKKTNLSGVKVPGGIAALLMFVLLIVFAIVPTKSGPTRLQLLWGVLSKGGVMRGEETPGTRDGSIADSISGYENGVYPVYTSPDFNVGIPSPWSGGAGPGVNINF